VNYHDPVAEGLSQPKCARAHAWAPLVLLGLVSDASEKRVPKWIAGLCVR